MLHMQHLNSNLPLVNGIIHSNCSQYYKQFTLYEICKLRLKNIAFHLMLASLLLFSTVCLPCDAGSTHTAFKPTKTWSLLFAKPSLFYSFILQNMFYFFYFILPFHCWDLPVIGSEAIPWQWQAPVATGWSSGQLGQTLPHLLPWVLTASLPTCGLCWGIFGSSRAESGFQQSSAKFHISFNILHFRHKTSLGKMMKPYPRLP